MLSLALLFIRIPFAMLNYTLVGLIYLLKISVRVVFGAVRGCCRLIYWLSCKAYQKHLERKDRVGWDSGQMTWRHGHAYLLNERNI